jgi:hypothetical protein
MSIDISISAATISTHPAHSALPLPSLEQVGNAGEGGVIWRRPFFFCFLLYIYILWTRIPKSTLGSQPTHAAATVSLDANLDRPMFVDAGHGQGQGQDQSRDQNQSAGRQSTQAPPGYAQIPLSPQSGFDGDWRFANPGAPSSALTNRSADSGIIASPYEFLSQRSLIADRIDACMASRAASPPYGRDLSGRSLRATEE